MQNKVICNGVQDICSQSLFTAFLISLAMKTGLLSGLLHLWLALLTRS